MMEKFKCVECGVNDVDDEDDICDDCAMDYEEEVDEEDSDE